MVSEQIAKAQRKWPHRDSEQKMIEAERARRAEQSNFIDGEYRQTKPSPESVGSYKRRTELLIKAIHNLHSIDQV